MEAEVVAMRSKAALVMVAVLLYIAIAAPASHALDVDRLLQVLAWSANTSDYNMSIDLVRQPQTVRRGNATYTITEGNPMFVGDVEYFRTVLDLKNVLIEVAPDVLPKPWSTLALLAVFVSSGEAVAHNNRCFETVGWPTQFTLAYRYRW